MTTEVTTLTPEFVSDLLGLLENREAKLISWGFYDLSFTEDEIDELLTRDLAPHCAHRWEMLQAVGYDVPTLVTELTEAGLLYQVPFAPRRYRTRFAEGVRLIAHLRQLFRAEQWSTGPSLVSDIKVDLAPRRYPLRNEKAAACWTDLEPLCTQPVLQGRVFHALAQKPDGSIMAFAGFQRRAFLHLLGCYGKRGLSGSVISAGTGAGKTKAFYIPAFLGAVGDIAADPRPYTKIIAVYPRNVLLADQLREALAEASKIQSVLEDAGLRPLTFGALLGDTPPSVASFEGNGEPSYVERYTSWHRVPNGWVIPYLQSPANSGKALAWRDEDRWGGRTALFRADGGVAAPDVPDGTLLITREQLQESPPDVLFLSAEMLNQQMGAPAWARTFGIAPRGPRPRLLLLDEVHTYEGIAGAQVAWVLRRWKHWSAAADLHVVGLSATLREAPRHLAHVTGLNAAAVREFRPSEAELEAADIEYNLAVKGNAASGSSLLATSIQTGMLLARLLTPRQAPRLREGELGGDAFYGRKVFGFTDNLDVLNRWYADMLDAEQRRRLARLRQHPDERLPPVALPRTTIRRMELEGQIWGLPDALGHDLTASLAVSRCSSQDPGANAQSELIVATSSLEVGYDDPDVGASLHHKGPRSLASFIQRKGRAGRRRGMRPWTVVVLSDYGADRWAFQNVESLFQPEVDAILLPITNSHVLRIQAVYFLIDWVGRRIGQGSPFEYLRGPKGSSSGRARVIPLLKEILDQGAAWRDFQQDFRALFRYPRGRGGGALAESVLDSLLWEAPRPLLRHAIPSLLRKLEANWTYADPSKSRAQSQHVEDAFARRPIPLYLPAATFAELDVGETRIVFGGDRPKEEQSLSVSRALAESCPGNASKRFSVAARESGYWLSFAGRLLNGPVPPSAPVAELYQDRVFLDAIDGVRVYQPQVVVLEPIARGARDTSKAMWQWRTRIRPRGAGQALPILRDPQWRDIVQSCEVYLHRDYASVEVLRYADCCRYDIRRVRRDPLVGRLELRGSDDSGHTWNEAVGFRKIVDGIAVRIAPHHLSQIPQLDDSLLARFRADYYRDRLRTTSGLPEHVSSFLREWLWQMSLAMLSATAARNGCSLEEAQNRLSGRRSAAAQRVLESIFHVPDLDGDGAEEARLRTTLLQLWNDPLIVGEIGGLEQDLWRQLGPEFDDWVRRRYVATLAQAIRAAAVATVAEISEDDLVVDVAWTSAGGADIYLTEMNSGGLGLIELVAAAMRQAPSKFHAGLRHYLSWCPRNDLIASTRKILHTSRTSGELGDVLRGAFGRVRAAGSFSETEEARDMLRAAVAKVGFTPSRPLTVSVVTKLLQSGSSEALDALVQDLNDERERLTVALRLSLDPRVFCYGCLHTPTLRQPLEALLTALGGERPTDNQLYTIFQRLVLDGCLDSCPDCLNQPNTFNDFGTPSRALVQRWLALGDQEVSAEESGSWVESARQALLENARVRLVVPTHLLARVVPALQTLLAQELESMYLLLPISISRIERSGAAWAITLEVKEGLPD